MNQELVVQEGFSVIRIEADSPSASFYEREVNTNFIQMHFCLKGNSQLHYGPHYSLNVNEQSSVLLYNPDKDLPINLTQSLGGKHLIFIVSIKMFQSSATNCQNQSTLLLPVLGLLQDLCCCLL